MMSLAEEAEGHVFDHEPGQADYHHGWMHHPEETEHIEHYAEARYPVFLEQHNEVYEAPYHHPSTPYGHFEENEAEPNLYHSFPVYSPMVPHDWMLHQKQHKKHSFSDADEFEFQSNDAVPRQSQKPK